jgi:hypothetical protein
MHALARHAALAAPDSPATAASSPGPQPEVTSHEFDAATATSQLCLASSATLLPASRSRYRTSRPVEAIRAMRRSRMTGCRAPPYDKLMTDQSRRR